MKYYVRYIKYCSPGLVEFSNKKRMVDWINKFPANLDEGSWIDFSFKTDSLDIFDDSVKVRKIK
jgi:hypothetical protein